MTRRATPLDPGGIPARWSSECPNCGGFIERGKTLVTFDRGTQICVVHGKAAQ